MRSQYFTPFEDYFSSAFGVPREVVAFVSVALLALQLLLIPALAAAVWMDGRKKAKSGESLFLIPAWMWALVVLASGGYFGALAYWLIHYSSLRHRREEKG